MGDIQIPVRFKGATVQGALTKKAAHNLTALVDTGATRTIISTRVAKLLGIRGLRSKGSVRTGSGQVQVYIGFAYIQALGCQAEPLAVAISDELTEGAGVEVVLGHDYMQPARMQIDMETLTTRCSERKPPATGGAKKRGGNGARAAGKTRPRKSRR